MFCQYFRFRFEPGLSFQCRHASSIASFRRARRASCHRAIESSSGSSSESSSGSSSGRRGHRARHRAGQSSISPSSGRLRPRPLSTPGLWHLASGSASWPVAAPLFDPCLAAGFDPWWPLGLRWPGFRWPSPGFRLRHGFRAPVRADRPGLAAFGGPVSGGLAPGFAVCFCACFRLPRRGSCDRGLVAALFLAIFGL